MELIIGGISGIVLGVTGFLGYKKISEEKKKSFARSESERILNKARQDAKMMEQRGREHEQKIKKSADDIQNLQKSKPINNEILWDDVQKYITAKQEFVDVRWQALGQEKSEQSTIDFSSLNSLLGTRESG